MMKRLLLILVLCASWQANATSYYWCDCLTGADGACVVGANGNLGTSSGAPWQTMAKLTGAFFSGLAAGDQLLFCKGGSISGTAANFQNIFLQNLNATAANPIIFDSYDPGWGAGAKPIITAAVDASSISAVFNLQNSGNSRHDKGYIIRNLSLSGGPHFLGTSTGSNSITTLNDTGTAWGNLVGYTACLYAGTASNATCRTVSSNTATQITVSSAWPGGTPDATTKYWLRGATYGVNSSNDVWDVALQNLTIEGFGSGVNCSGGGSTTLFDGDGTSQFWTVRDSLFQYNDTAILSGCSNVLIENNTLDHNSKPASTLDHSIYLDDGINALLTAYPFSTAILRHNTITNSSVLAAGNCVTTVIVVHGKKTAVEITENDIGEPTVNSSSGGCWPISVNFGYSIGVPAGEHYSDEGFDRLRILRNKLTNFGFVGIDLGISHDAEVSGNSLYTDYASGAGCIHLASQIQDPTVQTNDYTSTSNKVSGNSCYIKNPTDGSIPFKWAKHARDSGGSGNIFVNNLVYFGVGTTAAAQCFSREPTSGTSGVTVSIASPAVVTLASIAAVVNQPIRLTTSGALPTGLTAGTTVYVKTVLTADTFTVSATPGGAEINTSGTQSGTHTIVAGYPPSAFSAWDNNLCYYSGTLGRWDSFSGSLAQFRTDTGFDANSLTTDPQITAPTSPSWSLATPVGSPANGAGNAANKSRISYDGCLTPTPPPIGAVPYRAAACNAVPNSPSGLR